MRRAALFATLFSLALCASPSGATAASRNFVVFFESWSVALQPAAIATIKTAATVAKQNAAEPVNVTGYADPVGGKEVNMLLSKARAQIVVDQLVADGVAAARIHSHAVGIVGYKLSSQESRRAVITLGSP